MISNHIRINSFINSNHNLNDQAKRENRGSGSINRLHLDLGNQINREKHDDHDDERTNERDNPISDAGHPHLLWSRGRAR